MKKVLCILFAVLLLTFSLVGCSRYSSHYDTVGHVCSNDSDSAWMSFVEFEGTEVFKLKCKSKDQAIIVYSGKLEAGSLTVYYDCGGTKRNCFLFDPERIFNQQEGTFQKIRFISSSKQVKNAVTEI